MAFFELTGLCNSTLIKSSINVGVTDLNPIIDSNVTLSCAISPCEERAVDGEFIVP